MWQAGTVNAQTPHMQAGWTEWQPLGWIEQDLAPAAAPNYTLAPHPYMLMRSMQPPKSRLAYILLALFLGGFGIHNFYAGRTTQGVVQLLLAIFTGWLVIPLLALGIWIIVEICTVDTDASGTKMS